MATPQQRGQTVIWYAETKSVILTQRNYRRVYGGIAPDGKTIKLWFNKLLTTGSVLKQSGGARRSVTEEKVEEIRVGFQRSPSKSIRQASRQFNVSPTTVHRVLHKRLRLYPYKVQIVQQLKPNDNPRRQEFAIEILDRIDRNPDFLDKVLFSDEATFHVSGVVNRHNVRIWGTENPHVYREHVRDSPKLNVWCGLMKDRIIGPFFFHELTVTGTVYLDMLEQFVYPQIVALQPIIFQQDGAPPHWSMDVRGSLNATFPNRWIGRDGPIHWPPRSPDLTPLDFFLWGYVKDRVFATPVNDVAELQTRIRDVIATVTGEMLMRTFQEVEYRLDIVRATNGAHVEVH